jgi:hypothetical protein
MRRGGGCDRKSVTVTGWQRGGTRESREMIGKAGNFGLIPYKQWQTRTPETADRSSPIRDNQTSASPFSLFPLFLLLLDLCKHRLRLVLRPSCRSQVEQSSGGGTVMGDEAADEGRKERVSIATTKQTTTNKCHPGPRIPLTCCPPRVLLCALCVSQQRLSWLPWITRVTKKHDKKKARRERE